MFENQWAKAPEHTSAGDKSVNNALVDLTKGESNYFLLQGRGTNDSSAAYLPALQIAFGENGTIKDAEGRISVSHTSDSTNFIKYGADGTPDAVVMKNKETGETTELKKDGDHWNATVYGEATVDSDGVVKQTYEVDSVDVGEDGSIKIGRTRSKGQQYGLI